LQKASEETRVELKQLRYFVRIVDLGSLSRAAGEVFVAQSALSQHVAALEDEFKTRLLNRSARGVSPTEAGKQLYRHAQLLLKQAEDAKASMASGCAGPAGPVALGVPLSLVATLAFPIFDAVRERFPFIRLQVQEELSGTILEWIKSGRLSIGIAFDDGNLEGLEVTRVLEERLFLVASPKSPLARRKAVTLSELEQMDLVLPCPGQGVRPRVERAMVRAGLTLTRVCAEVNSLVMLKQTAAAGIGPTILGWPCIASEVAEGKLAAVEIVRPAIVRVAALCRLSAAAHSQATECVKTAAIEVIRNTVRKAAWRGVRCVDS